MGHRGGTTQSTVYLGNDDVSILSRNCIDDIVRRSVATWCQEGVYLVFHRNCWSYRQTHVSAIGPELISSDGALERAANRLASAESLAFDTESASFHRYVDRVYLVQISSSSETVLVDPLAVSGMAPVGRLLEDPDIEAVFHDADYDLRTLDRDYGFRATRLFDTRVAAQLANEDGIGLAALLERHFGVTLNKKYQRADWSLRPLTNEMIAYAASDTMYLIRLKNALTEKLENLGRYGWAAEEFARLEHVRWTASVDDEAFLRIKGARALKPRQRAVLRELHQWRDRTARALDRTPFRVVTNDVLLAIAKASPSEAAQLSSFRGFPRSGGARGWIPEILAAVRRGTDLPAEQLPQTKKKQRPQRDPAYEQRLDQLKELRNRRAAETGIYPGLLCPNGTLQAIAHASANGQAALAELPELRMWQREVLGDDELAAATSLPSKP